MVRLLRDGGNTSLCYTVSQFSIYTDAIYYNKVGNLGGYSYEKCIHEGTAKCYHWLVGKPIEGAKECEISVFGCSSSKSIVKMYVDRSGVG